MEYFEKISCESHDCHVFQFDLSPIKNEMYNQLDNNA